MAIEERDYIGLTVSGAPKPETAGMNLTLIGPDSADVYNSVALTTASWNELQAGSGTPGLNLVNEYFGNWNANP